MHEDIYRLIDEEYLENNINEILSLNEYIPSILTGVMCEIYINPDVYAQWKYSIRKDVNRNLWSFYIKQKSLHQSFAHICSIQSKRGWFSILLELLIFLELHPEYYGMIKDEKYLKELIDECENEYNINVMNYINNYGDLKKLFKYMSDNYAKF